MFSRVPLIKTRHVQARAKATYLEVTVVGASELPKAKLGNIIAGDKYYVKIGINGTMNASTAAIGSHEPRWNQSFSLVSDNAGARLVLEVFRKRRLQPTDKIVGRVTRDIATLQNGNSNTFREKIVSTTDDGAIKGQLLFTVVFKTDGNPTDLARSAIDSLKTPGVIPKAGNIMDGVADAAGAASGQLQNIETIVSPLVDNLKVFSDLVGEFSKIHPYAQAAWNIISAVYQVYDRQKRMDDNVRELFVTMNALYVRVKNFQKRLGSSGSEILDVNEEVLLRLAKQTLDCSYFIQQYCRPSFAGRLVQHILKNADDKVAEYQKIFASMEKEFEGNVFESTYIFTTVILDEVEDLHVELELQKLPIAVGASLVVATDNPKHCLPGTRTFFLSEMIAWINGVSVGSESQRVLLLTGLAGSGKSTIACTIASYYNEIGRLGASFAFSRQNKSRGIAQLFPHIARLVARLGGAVQKALAEVISSNEELLAVTDLRTQFGQFLVEPLKGLTITGPIVVVIDAIDEASDGTHAEKEQLEELIAVITEMASALPSNIRIVITSRPEHIILGGISGCSAVLRKDMSEITADLANNDVYRYVQARLLHRTRKLNGIDEESCWQIALKSQGLFQWAYIACWEIIDARGSLPRKKYERIIDSGVQGLDMLYAEVLKSHFDAESRANFVSVMSFILALQEPVSIISLGGLWEAAGGDLEVLETVLDGMRSLLDGIDETTKDIQLSHTSFRDFVSDVKRSGEYCVDVHSTQKIFVLACFRIMRDQLSFNMCNLESSHMLNRDVLNLRLRVNKCIRPECLYACHHWADHLKQARQVQDFFHAVAFQDVLVVFLGEKLLFWLEVLSVSGKVSAALPSMSVLAAHLVDSVIYQGLQDTISPSFAKDVQDFIQLCAPVASLSAPHIYLSALPFTPPNSAISKLYGSHFTRILKVAGTASVLEAPRLRNIIHCPNTSRLSRGVKLHVSVSPDGMLIAADSGEDVFLYNIYTGERSHTLHRRNYEHQIYDLRFSADGTRLASCSANGVTIWDLKTRRTLGEPLRGHTGDVRSIAWSRDGQNLVSGSMDCTTRAWDTASCRQIWCGRSPSGTYAVTYSPDGAFVISVDRNLSFTMWHSDDGTPTTVRSLMFMSNSLPIFTPDGTRLASCRLSRGEMVVFDVQAEEIICEFTVDADHLISVAVKAYAFSPDGARIAAVSEDGRLQLWDLNTPRPISQQVAGTADTKSLVFSPAGDYVITASEDSIVVWDAGRRAAQDILRHTDEVGCIAFTPTRIISGSKDRTVRIWDSATGEAIACDQTTHAYGVNAVAVSPDGFLIASGSAGAVELSYGETAQCLLYVKGNKTMDRIRSVFFSKDGKQILQCSEHALVIRDVYTMEAQTDHDFQDSGSSACAFGMNRNLLIRAVSNQAFLWDITLQRDDSSWSSERGPSQWPGKLDGPVGSLSTDKMITSIAISSDESQIVFGHPDGYVSVWDLPGLNPLKQFKVHGGQVQAVAFFPNSAHIVSGSVDKTIRISNVGSGQVLGRPRYCGAGVLSLALSADCTRVASGLSNGHIQIWDVSPQTWGLGSDYMGPLLFSYNLAHAMPRADKLFQQCYPPISDIRDHIRRNADGFVVAEVNNEEQLLFWVPSHLRDDLLIPRRHMLLQMGRPLQLDLSQFVHGSDWTSCSPSPSR